MEIFVSHSERETAEWAARYASTLHAGDTVLLNGEMGAGKTASAKGIAKGLGITAEVTSPTYAYINSYEDKLFHFDCYRIEYEAQAERLGFADYFEMGGICLVEWGENIRGLLPEYCKEIQIIKRGDETREIRF